ncbi:protein GVQW3-like [Bactrocera oleae]|uniref:protein GVQW3-like n=1 Tax=Bactrocera oleae TaxID=104688 RepID=UPI00387E363D
MELSGSGLLMHDTRRESHLFLLSCVESLQMLEKACAESILSKIQIYDWYKAFKDGRETVEDMSRSDRSSTCTTDENIKKVREIVRESRHASIIEVASTLIIGREAARLILTDNLAMRRVNAWLVPKELNFS